MAVGDRVTTARLRADASQFKRELASAAAAAKAFDAALRDGSWGDLDKDLQASSRAVAGFTDEVDDLNLSVEDANANLRLAASGAQDFDRSMRSVNTTVGRSSNQFGRASQNISFFGLELGNAENRMQTITQAILAIGPAALPALAAVGTGVVALVGQLTFAATGAATAALAFAGVFDALKSLNEVGIDPSVANIEKLQEAMDQLGPEGQRFVFFLQEARGELHRLQDIAGAGLLPGLQAGLDSLLRQMPLLENIVTNVSLALGDMAKAGGQAFENDEWQKFFTYLATDADRILTSMGHTLGLFVQGLASIITAFGPVTASFSSGLEKMAGAFADWAASLDTSEGFATFIDYVMDVTPQLLDTLAAIGVALVDLGAATSSLGPTSLVIIEGLARILSAFLETPIAPFLIGLASALAAVSTALRIGRWAGAAQIVTFFKALGPAAVAAAAGLRTFNVSAIGFSKINWAGATKGAGALSLIALSMTEMDEQAGVSNFANFAALGALLGGPYGVAIGATVGGTLELVKANRDLGDSFEELEALPAGAISKQIEKMKQIEEEAKNVSDLSKTYGVLGGLGGILGGFILGEGTEAEALLKLEKHRESLEGWKETISAISNIGSTGRPLDITGDVEKLDAAATEAEPVLRRLNLTMEQADQLWQAGGATRQQFINDFEQMQQKMDDLGSSRAVVQAMSDLDRVIIDTADSASALATALDSLVSPFLDLVESRDAWNQGLADLDKNLKKTSASLFANTDASRANREVIGTQIELLIGYVNGMAKAGKGSEELARVISSGREAFVQQAIDAGIARKEIEKYLDRAGLTPKLIRTIFEAQGITEAESDARNLADAYNKLPKEVRVAIKDEGIPKTEEGLKRLARQFELTPKQLRVIADLRDHATVKIDKLRAKLRQVSGEVARPKADMNIEPFQLKAERIFDINRKISGERPKSEVQADTTAAEQALARSEKALKNWDVSEGEAEATVDDKASPTIDSLMDDLRSLDAFIATPTINTIRTTTTGEVSPNKGAAEGGLISGPGGPTSDTAGIFALSDQEFVNRAASVKHYGPDAFFALNDMRADRDAIRRAAGLAQGGLVGMAQGGRPRNRGDRLTAGDVFSKTLRDPSLMLNDINRALHDMRDEARDVVVAERELRQEREEAKNLARRVKEAEKGEGGVPKHLRDQQKAQAKELEAAEKALSKQRDELSKATDKLKNQEKALLAQAQAVSDAITASGEIFGGSGTSVTAAGILSKLRHATQDARQFKEDIAVLRARGLDESLISQLYEQGSTPEGVRAVHSLATASKSMLNRINRQQGRLERIGAAAGSQSVQKGGDIVVNINGPIHTTDVHQLAKELPKHLRKAVRIAMAK